MGDNSNKNKSGEQPKQEVKEVLVQTKKDTSTKPTTFEDRAKIEAEVTMIKIGINSAQNWIFRRSDKMTAEDKKMRETLVECIRNGLGKQQIFEAFRNKGLL